MTKCSFCHLSGHNITTCAHPSIRNRAIDIERIVSYNDLVVYLNSCPSIDLSALCGYYKLGTSGNVKLKTHSIIVRWIYTHRNAAFATAPEGLYRQVFPTPIQVQETVTAPDMSSEEDDQQDSLIIQAAREILAQNRANVIANSVDNNIAGSVQGLSIQLPSTLPSAQTVRHVPSSPNWPPPGVTMSEFNAANAAATINRYIPRTPPGTPPRSVQPESLPTRGYTSTIMPLSSVSTLTIEDDTRLENLKRERTAMVKAVGVDAYMSIRTALLELDGVDPVEYPIRLVSFNRQKDEILTQIRHRVGNSVTDYATAMLEYNRMLRDYPLFVSVPNPPSSSSVAAPQAQASMHQLRASVQPLARMTTANSVTTPPPITLARYSNVPNKRHLLALRVKVEIDLSLYKMDCNTRATAGGLVENVDECKLCCNTYNNQKTSKTRLNCHHNSCLECVVNIAKNRSKNSICCPFCREEIKNCYVGTTRAVYTLEKQLEKL
jgi:hypothetical protein